MRNTQDVGERRFEHLCSLCWPHGSAIGAIEPLPRTIHSRYVLDTPRTPCSPSGDAAIGALVGNQRPGRRGRTPIEIRNPDPACTGGWRQGAPSPTTMPSSHVDVGWVFVKAHAWISCLLCYSAHWSCNHVANVQFLSSICICLPCPPRTSRPILLPMRCGRLKREEAALYVTSYSSPPRYGYPRLERDGQLLTNDGQSSLTAFRDPTDPRWIGVVQMSRGWVSQPLGPILPLVRACGGSPARFRTSPGPNRGAPTTRKASSCR